VNEPREISTTWSRAIGLRLLVSEFQGRWLGRAIGAEGREVWNSGYARASEAAVRTAFNTWARHNVPQVPQVPLDALEATPAQDTEAVGLVERLALLVSSLDIQSMRISALIDKADMIFDRAERVLKELS
jgi:hypothetical protein